MKKILWILAALALACALCFAAAAEETGVAIDEEHFPEVELRKIIWQGDLDGDGILSAEEAEGIVEVFVMDEGIKTLRGIEYLTGLEELAVGENELTELDVSRNAKLKRLMCWGNRLTALDLSGNPELTELYCYGNELTELDVSGNPKLEELYCEENPLTGLDLGSNPALTRLGLSGTWVKDLDLSGHTGLKSLWISDCPGLDLDVSIYPDLEILMCPNCGLTKLDLGGNPKLFMLDCSGNALTALDLGGNPALIDVNCKNNRLTALDLSHNAGIIELSCSGNPLETLDISACRELARTAGTTEPTEEDGVLVWETNPKLGQYYARDVLSVDKTVLLTGTDAGTGEDAGESPAGIRGDAPVYWDPDGAVYYHLASECYVSSSRLGYCCTYAELGQEPYSRLKPCEACSVPMERTGETPYRTYGQADSAESAGGSYSWNYCIAGVRRDGKYYRVVARYDEKAKELLAEMMAFDYEEQQEESNEASSRFFNYCKSLPVSYEEEITAVPLSQEEVDALAGKSLGELRREGFDLRYHYSTTDSEAVFYVEKGFFEYCLTVEVAREEYEAREKEDRFNDLTVTSTEISGLTYEAYSMEYRPDGTKMPREGEE